MTGSAARSPSRRVLRAGFLVAVCGLLAGCPTNTAAPAASETVIHHFTAVPNPVPVGGTTRLAWRASHVGTREGSVPCSLSRHVYGDAEPDAAREVACEGSEDVVVATNISYRLNVVRRPSGDGSEEPFLGRDLLVQVMPVAVSLVPDTLSLGVNESHGFTATVSGASDTRVVWGATCGSIAGNGSSVTYGAPSTPGTCRVTAGSVASPDRSASVDVTVLAAPEPVIVGVEPASVTLQVDETQSFTASVTGASDGTVVWSASCGRIGNTGNTVVYTAPASSGTCFVTATSAEDPTRSATATATITPAPPSGIFFVDLEAKGYHSLALDQHGNAWAWGRNGNGELGDGTTAGRALPAAVAMPSGVGFTDLTSGWHHSLALDRDGNAWAWGLNWAGQLGDGGTASHSTPVAVSMPPGVAFAAIAAGWTHSLALDGDGNAWAWGNNASGQLGVGFSTAPDAPTAVVMPEGVSFTSIAGGGVHSLALDQDGNAWAWGSNENGQLGNGSSASAIAVPVQVSMPTGIVFTSLVAGYWHSLALDQHGGLWAWGYNANGEVGDGSLTERRLPVRVDAPAGVAFGRIASGWHHSVAFDPHGNAWAWGANGRGQLGDGTTTARSAPVLVGLPAGVGFDGVTAGSGHSLMLDVNGRAWAWGANPYGQLGDGSGTDQVTPVQVVMP